MATKTYKGSCHCGAMQYEADIDFSHGTGKCNCGYCTKIRSWKVFIKPEALRVLKGQDAVTGYSGKNPTAVRYFCKTCGVYTHETGNAEWMDGPFAGVFLGSLDDASIDELMSGPVQYSDGRNNNWMNPPADVRNL